MRNSAVLLLGLWVGLITTVAAQDADPARVERLRASLQVRDPVPGVNRGWEGDPRTETWVSRCDDRNDGNACWLVGIELAPSRTFNRSGIMRRYNPSETVPGDTNPSPEVYGVRYLQKACDLDSGEACADLGDFYRFWARHQSDWDGRSDLRRAHGYYRRACEFSSAYGCYVLAEVTDRGIGTPRDAAAAKSLFGELCQSGVAIACLRQSAPAEAYPYKSLGPSDSACATSDECWNECKQGIWGACDKAKGAPPMAAAAKEEVYALSQRACREGSDWGCGSAYSREARLVGCEGKACKKASAARPLKAALLEGCQAGSRWACQQACQTFSMEVGTELACDTRFRTYAGYRFKNPNIQMEMQDCFGGGEVGCSLFLERTDIQMNPDEANAYRASAYFFHRMECNSGQKVHCKGLVEHHGTSQLGWAYQIAGHASLPPTDPFFQSFTPMERAMASGWLMYALSDAFTLPQDVIIALDGVCTRGYPDPLARTCRVLAEYFTGKSRTYTPDAQREAQMTEAMTNLETLEESRDISLRSCLNVGPGQTIVVLTPEIKACQRKANKNYEESRAFFFRDLDFWQSQPATIVGSNPELTALANQYWVRACKAGDISACNIAP